MAKTNVKRTTRFTAEGAPAKTISPEQELRRITLACMLWEDEFYIDGVSTSDCIKALIPQVDPKTVAALAIEIRTTQKLRHVPLLIMRELARHGKLYAGDLAQVIQRPDEMGEFLALYWSDGKCPLAGQVKKGLAEAFTNFDAYQLSKWNRDAPVKLRDVLFLCHAKPNDEKQQKVWKALIDGTLATADTWETNLSAGEDKKTTFTRLLNEDRLGYMALLRNLRNMQESGVEEGLVFQRLLANAERSKALPFRFISAARAVPQWERQIDQAMGLAMGGMPKLPGKTIVLVDVSGSMVGERVSAKSDIDRLDAAAALAALVAGIAESYEVYTFSERVRPVPSRTGMALVDVIRNKIHGCTYLGGAVKMMNTLSYDRLIVMTDEQSHDSVGDPKGRGYMINVASNRNGVGYGKWTSITGFSEAVIQFIQELEA